MLFIEILSLIWTLKQETTKSQYVACRSGNKVLLEHFSVKNVLTLNYILNLLFFLGTLATIYILTRWTHGHSERFYKPLSPTYIYPNDTVEQVAAAQKVSRELGSPRGVQCDSILTEPTRPTQFKGGGGRNSQAQHSKHISTIHFKQMGVTNIWLCFY